MYVVRKQRARVIERLNTPMGPKAHSKVSCLMWNSETPPLSSFVLSRSDFPTIFSDHHHPQQILPSAAPMVSEEPDMPIGWPLGLEVMNMRLRVVESLQASVVVEPHSMHMPSTSFSSFSSSNLDTESTASFFQDNSVPLGRLIGFRSGDGSGGLYFPNRMRLNECERTSERGAHPTDLSRGHSMEMSQGICIPLLLGILVKMSRSAKSSPKH